MIAAKLQDGVEIQAILDLMRDGVQGTEIGLSVLVNFRIYTTFATSTISEESSITLMIIQVCNYGK